MTLIVPPTVTISMNTSEPISPSVCATTRPRVVSTFAPSARMPLMCWSIGLRPMSHPPGRGTCARPKRASSAPM